jgi:ssDNA-binding replication factor A large subunit
VGDETGMLTLSLWDDKADLVGELREGDVIRLHGVSVREKLGELRLSLGRSGELEKVNAVLRLVAPTRVSSLATVKGLVTVEGTVADQPVIRQVSTEKGETIEVASFTLKEETGSTRVTFWRDQVSLARELRPNCRLRITGVRVRPGLNGQMELSSVPVTTVSILSTPIEKPAWEDIRKIISLEAGLKTWIKGQVVESGDRKLKIDDGTGVTDVAWDDNISNQIGNMSEVIGKELEIYGSVQKIDENKLIFKAAKVLITDK